MSASKVKVKDGFETEHIYDMINSGPGQIFAEITVTPRVARDGKNMSTVRMVFGEDRYEDIGCAEMSVADARNLARSLNAFADAAENGLPGVPVGSL